jgi:DnaJ-domain-containing protein 1
MNPQEICVQLTKDKHLAHWTPDEWKALLRVLYGLYKADGNVSEEEMQDLQHRMAIMGIEAGHWERLTLKQALMVLKEDKAKHELMYLILATAVFQDGRYTDEEQDYLERLIEEYGLSRTRMDRHLRAVQATHVSTLLEEWLKEHTPS